MEEKGFYLGINSKNTTPIQVDVFKKELEGNVFLCGKFAPPHQIDEVLELG